MLVLTDDIEWQWVDNNDSAHVLQNAVVGGYSPEGKPFYLVLAFDTETRKYYAGNQEKDNTYAEYEKYPGAWESQAWQYLIVSTNVTGVFGKTDIVFDTQWVMFKYLNNHQFVRN